jgi:hypothetical protein
VVHGMAGDAQYELEGIHVGIRLAA